MRDAPTARGAAINTTTHPREFEAALLLEAALRLQDVQNRWDSQKHSVEAALSNNRSFWSLFLASACDPAHPLPVEIRQTIGNLAVFVSHETFAIAADPCPERLTTLIGINRELAAGLLGRV